LVGGGAGRIRICYEKANLFDKVRCDLNRNEGSLGLKAFRVGMNLKERAVREGKISARYFIVCVSAQDNDARDNFSYREREDKGRSQESFPTS